MTSYNIVRQLVPMTLTQGTHNTQLLHNLNTITVSHMHRIRIGTYCCHALGLIYYMGTVAQNRWRTRKYEYQGAHIRTPRLSSLAVSLRVFVFPASDYYFQALSMVFL
jgi:hypothetical protein